ncbi:helix-turn-helix domain-containing protein [Streptomyces sp. NPDC048409]|uniref:TetR/AcrR family transcriptional regulator n=1 Tax=Streptomyces sp. NPDC048409 TaxID=3154723 RepID=UPI003415D3E5
MLEDEKVDAILDAAYICFTRHGVRRTTMDDIARQAGMSRPAVYQYVRNKEDAFRRLAERLLGDTLSKATLAAGGPGSLTERLSAALACKLALVARLWQDSPAHAAELLGPDSRLSADKIELFDGAMRELLASVLAAEHPHSDVASLAEILLAFTRGLETGVHGPRSTESLLRDGVALITSGIDALRP